MTTGTRAGHNKSRRRESGFTLVEVVCVVAIIAMLAALSLPSLPRSTSKPRLESYAVAVAALLKADRNTAIRHDAHITTEINAPLRLIRSGATGRLLQLPNDISVDALLGVRCGQYTATTKIHFFPSGSSCGGVVGLTRADIRYEVRVNWLTGGIELVSSNRV